MTEAELIIAYSKLSAETQIRVLARFARDVTVIARDTYVPGGDGVSDARRLRQMNELLHRVLGQLDKMLARDSQRFADDGIAAICVVERDPRLLTAFSRALRECAGTPGSA